MVLNVLEHMLLNGAAQIEGTAMQCSTQADNNSRKLRLRCGCQFRWCALALRATVSPGIAQPLNKGDIRLPTYLNVKDAELEAAVCK
jgi:hypothetical protein